jgi:hypothetical protein
MSVSGHETLREVERYTKAADSAIYALQEAQKGDGVSEMRNPGLACSETLAKVRS